MCTFFQPKYRSEIVYSGEIATSRAVEFAYESSSSEFKILENSALLLRIKILEKQTDNTETAWPPTSDYLHSCPVPEHLTKFLLKLFTPTKVKNVSSINERKIQ